MPANGVQIVETIQATATPSHWLCGFCSEGAVSYWHPIGTQCPEVGKLMNRCGCTCGGCCHGN